MASKEFITPERLARTTDGRLVPYEDPDAAYLAYRPGDAIPLEAAIDLGLVKDDETPEPEAKAVDETPEPDAKAVDEKQVDPAENKMVAAPADKGHAAAHKRAR